MDTLLNKRSQLLYILFLILLTTAAYRQLADNGFITAYDDGKYVVNNASVQAGLTPKSVSWAFTTARAANWHPLTWISHILDCRLYGLKPAGHHLTSLLIHTVSAVLLFLLLERISGRRRRALFVAVLFAIHPLHVQSVAWVAERKDVLSTFFWMLTLLAYVFYAAKPSIRRYLLVVFAFVMGLLAKPMLVSLPLVLLMLDYWPLGRMAAPSPLRARDAVLEKLPLFILAAGSCAATLWAQRSAEAVASLAQNPLGVRAANALVAYVVYILKMLWPANLAVFYPHPGANLPVWEVIACGLLLAAITLAAVRLARSRPYIIVGWLWYVVTLIPVIGLVQVGQQAMADRYTYVPLIGLFIVLAWGVPDLLSHKAEPMSSRRGVALTLAAGIALLALAARTSCEVGYWRDSVTLFTRAIETTSGNSVAHYNLGTLFQKQKRWDEAAIHYEEALRSGPDHPDIRMNLASVRMRQGYLDDARANFEAALRLNPRLAEAHKGLGIVLVSRGKPKEAVEQYSQALAIAPRNPSLHYNLGNALVMAGDLEEAAAHLSQAIQLKPDYAAAHHNLGLVYQCRNRIGDAVREFRQASLLEPDNPRLHARLAAAFYAGGDYSQARQELQIAEELGLPPDSEFKKALSLKMPKPGN